eukprot:TRINITY_DN5740_c0_g1_i1.p1 TRINITY_DN5740_c0_g1~~TRINITY_DN5740_c0_g1_i1.p1  ORF type:complete len:120 (-),score=17.95 TRINITY_DN5740_c0_g1_i1:440-799(-)
MNGLGCAVDHAEATRHFEKAGNHVFALYCLAYVLYWDKGILRDRARAVQLFQQAAEQGHYLAQFELGVAYMTGEFLPEDVQQAKHWLQMAADQGYWDAKRRCDALSDSVRGLVATPAKK